MKKTYSAFSLIIIICLGISSAICAKGVLESLVSKKADSWLSGQPEIFTSQLTDEQQNVLVSTLQGFSADHGFIAISKNRTVHQSGAILYTFSVLAPSDIREISLDPLVILGTTVVDKALAHEVAAAGPDSYVGYGNDAFGRIADLPSIRSGVYFRIDRLSSGDELGGSCAIIGLEGAVFQELLDDLSSSVGVSAEILTTRMSGSSLLPALTYMFSAGTFILLSIVFCLFMATCALLELRTLGVYMMLGWSKRDFILKLFSFLAAQLVVVVPIGVVGTCLVLDGFAFSSEVIGYACASMAPTAVVVLASTGIAAIPLASVNPVDAIASRYSRHGFYVLTAAVYLLCLVAIFGGCLYIDQPISMYRNLIRTHSLWSEYANWHVLRDFRLDDARFMGNPMSFSEDMYAWYAAHEHDEGVFLVKATYYRDVTIHAYLAEGPYPEPFWYLAASPSYLRLIGIDVSDADVAKAESGVRVYLLPESLDSSQAEAMQRLLLEADKPRESNIVTAFMEDPAYEFSTYDGSRQLFTWSTDAEQPAMADAFVIAVVTASNMVPFESESLVASGLENSYIKLDEAAASALADDEGVVYLGEGVPSARFATVENYIDGLQKSLEELFALFSIILLMLVATMAVLVACLIEVVNRMSAREIGVKYVLGFGIWDTYRTEMLFVNLTTVAGIAFCGVLRCNAGMLVGGALLAISNLVILGIVRRRSVGIVLETVSKEQ